jgi:hypothetical protein
VRASGNEGSRTQIFIVQPVEEDWLLNPDILNQYGESGPTKACAWSGSDVSAAGLPASCKK